MQVGVKVPFCCALYSEKNFIKSTHLLHKTWGKIHPQLKIILEINLECDLLLNQAILQKNHHNSMSNAKLIEVSRRKSTSSQSSEIDSTRLGSNDSEHYQLLS